MKLSIVIPACNEDSRIGRMLDAYLPFFVKHYGDNVEFIVSINGSTDNTIGVVKSYMERFPCLNYINEPDNIGKGGGLIRGFEKAQGDFIGFCDADGSTSPEAFQDLVDNIDDAGLIIASRWCKGAKVSPKQPLSRRMASRIFNLITRFGFGLPLTDTQCGAKLMKREAIKNILPKIGITRWAFDVDLLFKMKKAGYKVKEIPTTWHDVEGSKVEVARASMEMLVALTRLRLLYSPFKWVVGLYDKYLGPFIHPPGVEQDYLLRHSLLLMSGVQVANVLNLLFQIIMMRMLTASEYGDMALVLRVLMIAMVSFGAFQWTLAHFSARFIKENKVDKIAPMFLSVGRDLFLFGVVVFLALRMFSFEVSSFFQLNNPDLVVVAGLGFIAVFCMPVFAGVLNGFQKFGWISSIGIVSAFSRIVLAVLLVALGWSAIGAVSAHILGLFVSMILSFFVLMRLSEIKLGKPARVPGLYMYFFSYAIALLCFSVLMNADVMLVKRYFTSIEAGLFAKVSTAASIVIFLPQPVTIAMFPKVVSSGGTSYGSMRTLIKALTLVLLIVGSIAVICTIFPAFILKVLSGGSSDELVSLLRGMIWAFTPISVAFVLMNFEFAQRRFSVAIPWIVCSGGFVAGVMIWHKTLWQVIAVLGVSGVVILIASVLFLPLAVLRKKP